MAAPNQQDYTGPPGHQSTHTTSPPGTYPTYPEYQQQQQQQQWNEHNYGGLEVNNDNGLQVNPPPVPGLEVHQPESWLEVNHERMGPQYIEGQPNFPPNVNMYSKDGKILSDGQGGYADAPPSPPPPPPTICGVRKRTFWIIIVVAAVVVIAAAVGGGVGGYFAQRNKNAAAAAATAIPKTSPVYQNSSIAAVQWKDGSQNNQYRVYFQHNNSRIIEAAWSGNASSNWNVTAITDDGADIVLGTSITAAIGYPHVNSSYALVSTMVSIE